jgi:hypothetical protein
MRGASPFVSPSHALGEPPFNIEVLRMGSPADETSTSLNPRARRIEDVNLSGLA